MSECYIPTRAFCFLIRFRTFGKQGLGCFILLFYQYVKERFVAKDKFYLDKISISGNDHRANFELIVKSFIDKETIMLDEGCGIADHLLVYSKGAKKIYGIDTNTELIIDSLENIKDRPEIEISWMDNNDLEFNNESFNIITNVIISRYTSSTSVF